MPAADTTVRLSLDVTAVPAAAVGAGQYTLELTGALASRPDVDLVLFGRRHDVRPWPVLAPGARFVGRAPGPRPLRLAWEQALLPGLLADSGVAVHHGPHYTMPERSRLPMVVTVHDLSFFEAPHWHQRSKVLVFRRAIRVAARRAAAVVCPSRVTAGELARWCRVEAEVFVAPHGVDAGRFRPDEPEEGADRAVLARLDPRLAEGRPFLLFVGTIEPRKDLPTLVGAFARVTGRHPEALLVLAGGDGWGVADVERAIEISGVASRIVRTGYVPDGTVPALLRSAAAVVYPALYEGFGLPALEALACGAPLVTTSGTAMEEVAGDAAVLVGPGDGAALTDAIDAELAAHPGGSPSDAHRRRRGLDIAAGHTWAESASRHMEAYRAAVKRSHSPSDTGPAGRQ
jgi:glycosyltransferase involved in cell wall biosynthesis